MPALGCGGLILVVVVALIAGVDPREILGLLGNSGQVSTEPGTEAPTGPPPTDQLGQFASVVLADTETRWGEIFAASGARYEPPRLVLFDQAVESACGFASSASGPFYCPLDHKVYLDLSFFNELDRRFGASGDFAAAYVIAHEVGHHVQNLMGLSEKVRSAQERASSEGEANALSVQLELQADCLAGIWAHSAVRQADLLETGDLDEALNAAAAVGDDRIQKQSGGQVNPDTFTHGSGEQRVKWFKAGFQSGDPTACDTFKGDV